jgi:N-acetylglutamate synthase-like GNAT family acetyltransferase
MDITIEVRAFSPEYKTQVAELIVSIQQQEFQIPITIKDQPDLGDIPNFYQKDNGNFWIALHDGKVVGTIALLDIGQHQAALRKMFVAPNYRGREIGAASKLLERLQDWARDKGLRRIYLGTTAQFLAAHRFYAKHGFTEIPQEALPPTFPLMAVDTKFYTYEFPAI